MALFRKFFFRKPPDGLLEISERLYVFKCCFNTSALEEDEYKSYIRSMVGQLRDQFPDASFMVFNFQEGENQSQIASILSSYDMTVMDYPCQYEGCPLLTMEMIHHFLRSSESWLLLGQQNLLLMNCARGQWPVLAFMLSALLIYRKQFTSEQKALDMIYKQVPQELLQQTMPVDPTPSQLRYLQYVSRRNVGSQWPPQDRTLTLDCVILRVVPNLGGKEGWYPIFRVYVHVPHMAADQSADIPPPKRGKHFGHNKQADCELVKIDIHCPVQGDVVLECTSLNGDQERELMIFRVMLNTSFIRSNILVLNCHEIDTLWDIKDQFPKDFRTEVLFSEMDSATPSTSIDLSCLEKKDGLPVEVFTKNRRIVSTMDLPDGKNDAERDMFQHISALQENLDAVSHQRAENGRVLLESRLEKVTERQKKKEPENASTSQEKPCLSSSAPPTMDGDSIKEKDETQVLNVVQPSMPFVKPPKDTNLNGEEVKPQELPDGPQSLAASKPVPNANSTEKFELQEIRIVTQSMPFFAPSPDATFTEKNFALQEQQFALQQSSQSKIISQQAPQNSLVPLVSHSNSLQESPTPISRYHNAPSAVGIMALLHDHAVSKGEEVVRPVTLSLPSSTILSPITNASKAVKLSNLSTLKASPWKPYLSLQSPTEALRAVENFPQAHPLPLCPTTLKSVDSSPNQHPEKSSSPILLSPLLSTPELFPSPATPAPPPPPPPSPSPSTKTSSPPLPPPPPSFPIKSPFSTIKKSYSTPPPPPPPGADLVVPSLESSLQSVKDSEVASKSPQPSPAPAPPCPGPVLAPTIATSVPPPPPSPSSALKDSSSGASTIPPLVPPVPSPPDPFVKGSSKASGVGSRSHFGIGNGNADVPPAPGPPSTIPFSAKGRGLRSNPRNQVQQRKANLKPYHWLKLTRAMQGSLWAEAQKSDEASEAPEFDISELESLFSVSAPNSDSRSTWKKSNKCTPGHKSDKVQLIELRRAYNCEIMLSKVKIPLSDLMTSVLALDDSALDVDQIDNMVKFCPTKEETELLKGYIGNKENLGKCEQFFLELMKVPRVESKLRVFSFKLQFHPQASELRNSLNVINSASEEIRSSVKLKRIMQAILSLGNALNHGTARGSAIGFRLDSLLKLADTRSGNNKMTLMHYLCKVLAEKLPELLDLPKDLVNLEAATKIPLKYLAEEMQAINKGLEKVEQELTASENDGPVSENFCQTLRSFLTCAESEVRSLASFYSDVGRNADALALYFGEDPGRCPFEQVVSILRNFVRMFVRAHEENCKKLEFEKKKAESNVENGILKMSPCKKESQRLMRSPIKRGNIK